MKSLHEKTIKDLQGRVFRVVDSTVDPDTIIVGATNFQIFLHEALAVEDRNQRMRNIHPENRLTCAQHRTWATDEHLSTHGFTDGIGLGQFLTEEELAQ